MALEEFFVEMHKKVHVDYAAMLVGAQLKVFVLKQTCHIEVKNTKRYCVTLPEISKHFSVPELLLYNNALKVSKHKQHFKKFRYRHRCKLQSHKCKVQKHKLFNNHKCALFICDPNEQKKVTQFDSASLYPQEYKYTKSDTEFVIDESGSESEGDTIAHVDIKNEDHSSILKNFQQSDLLDFEDCKNLATEKQLKCEVFELQNQSFIDHCDDLQTSR